MATHRIASGKTVAGNTAWVQYNGNMGVYLDVDTSAAHFATTPVYTTSLGGSGAHWSTIGATSIYSATATGFRVYVRWSNGNSLTPATANNRRWHINWIGMEV